MTQPSPNPTHKSVLVQEVLEYLNPQPGKVYLDVTFGAGGHTRAILEREPNCSVIAMDWDTRAIEMFGEPLKEEFGDRLTLLWGNFSLLYKILKKERIDSVDGILADFGTSQVQITQRAGFSVYRSTPLDMRMSPAHQKLTAEIVLNQSSELKLRELFWQLGEERYAKQIANAIIAFRQKKPIQTTDQLAAIIEKAVPHNPRVRSRIHPATRVFQALRIYVNNELDNIHSFLPVALDLLNPHGRLVCISFHSLEDRIVKQFLKDKEAITKVQILTPKVVTASVEELKQNPSARSACLRAAEVLSSSDGE